MSDKRIPEATEESPEEDEKIPSFCDIFIPCAWEDDEDNNGKKK